MILKQKAFQTLAQIMKLKENQEKLEWGFPNGTKYPPRQPIPNRAILPNRARVYRRTDRRTDGRTDGQGDSSIPPLTSLRGV